jgi:hypothetical protein
MTDEKLLQLLVDKGAAVDSHIQPAAGRGDEVLLDILLKGRPSVRVISQSLLSALKLLDTSTRLLILHLLLDSGADVNYKNGKAIFEATKAYQLSSLDLLLRSNPLPESLNAAFASATATTDTRKRYELSQSFSTLAPEESKFTKLSYLPLQ